MPRFRLKRAMAWVDPIMIQAELINSQQRDHGEGFVDFKQVYLRQLPAELVDQPLNRTDRGQGEIAWMQRMGVMPGNFRQRFDTRGNVARQNQRRGTVGDR